MRHLRRLQHADPPRDGDGGYMLITCLALLLFFTIITTVLLSMTFAAVRVTDSHARSAARVRAADGALEIVANQLRLSGAPGEGCVDSGEHSGFASSYLVETILGDGTTSSVIVECAAESVTGDQRVFHLTARTGSSHRLSGAARIRIDDSTGSAASPGFELIVCDWQLGKAYTGTLAACPST